MSTLDTTEHQAISRLFDLAREGDTDNCEFDQLDAMIYERMQRTYESLPQSAPIELDRQLAA